MLDHWKKLGLAILLITSFSACSHLAPIENVEHASIPTGSHALPLKTVGDIIAKAAIGRGWSVTQVKPNKLHAKIVRHDTYVAEIDITYSKDNYSIVLTSSENMQQTDGQILSAYNRYIDYLKSDIDKALNHASFD